jgi:hypothetical protein
LALSGRVIDERVYARPRDARTRAGAEDDCINARIQWQYGDRRSCPTVRHRPLSFDPTTELLERSGELAALERLLTAVLEDSSGRFVLVAGEAGAGKSVLLRRFCEQERPSVRILWGACDGWRLDIPAEAWPQTVRLGPKPSGSAGIEPHPWRGLGRA